MKSFKELIKESVKTVKESQSKNPIHQALYDIEYKLKMYLQSKDTIDALDEYSSKNINGVNKIVKDLENSVNNLLKIN